MVVGLTIIVTVAVIGYIAAAIIRHQYTNQAETIEFQIDDLAQKSLDSQMAEISKIALSGDSLKEVENMDNSYRYLMNRRLPEITEELADIKEQLASFKLFQIKGQLQMTEKKLADAKSQYQELANKISRLKKQALDYQKAVTELKEKYQAMRKTLLTKNFSYGPSAKNLEAQLKALEGKFEEYLKVLESGDLKQTDKLLKELRADTYTLGMALDKLPNIYRNFKNVYPDQIAELKSALEKMDTDGYGFKIDTKQLIAKIDQQLAGLTKALDDVELEACEELDLKLHDDIESLYTEIEKEYSARLHFEKRLPTFRQFLEHAVQQENKLLVELDHLSNNYLLNHHEQEDAHDLNKQLARIQKRLEDYNRRDLEEKICYSDQLALLKQDTASLTEIEQKQKAIADSVASLFQDEKEAKNAIQNFDAEMHRLKRSLDNLNLPGLPGEYNEYFLRVSHEVVALAKLLNQEQIDMDQIEKELLNTQSDLDALTKKTQEIIDASTLAQECFQYANRYRHKYPAVAKAQQEGMDLFEHCQYIESLDVIAQALEQVEEGSYKRLEQNYKQQR